MIDSELLRTIDDEFEKALKKNAKLKKLYQRIRDGTASLDDCYSIAIEVGEELSAALGEYIVPTTLADGRMAWAIADEVVRPELVKGYDITSSYFCKFQDAFNKAQGLRMQPVKPSLNEDKLHGILNKLTSEEYEEVRWLIEDSSYFQNFFESIVDDGIREAVDLYASAGIRPKITRTTHGGACKWCQSLAGEYDYPVDDEIYRRHRNCHCKVTYSVGDRHQDVWSKKEWYGKASGEELKRRKAISSAMHKLTPKQAQLLEEYIINNS